MHFFSICGSSHIFFRVLLLYLLSSCGLYVYGSASTNTPKNLPAASLPQFVLLSFDDYLTTNRYSHIEPLLNTGLKNPNGSDLRFTFFVNTRRNDYYLTHALWAAGNEIAVHTMSAENADLPGRTAERWRRELNGARKTLSAYASIPEEDITGFRAPNLWFTGTAFDELFRAGFLYDASAGEYLTASGLSKRVGARIYPYELDEGFQQVPVYPAEVPTNVYPGMFEVPIYPIMSNDASYVLTDNTIRSNAQEFLYALKSTFSNHYNGNRAPMTLDVHAQSLMVLPDRVSMYTNFMAWASNHSNTWFVTSREAVQFVQAPQTHNELKTNDLYGQPLRVGVSETNFHYCEGLAYTLRTAVECPVVYPFWSNQYHSLQEENGAAFSAYRYTVTDGTNVYDDLVAYSLVVSNSSDYDAMEWHLTYTTLDATNRAFYDVDSVTPLGGERYRLSPNPSSQSIQRGGVNSNVHILVRLTNGLSPAVFTNISLIMQVYKPNGATITQFSKGAASSNLMVWTESGYEYAVETAPAIHGPWTTIYETVYDSSNYLVRTLTNAFYRVRSSP